MRTSGFSERQTIAADFNRDGSVDGVDLNELSRFLLTGEYDKVSDIEYADRFTVSKVFSSDMVVQRDENLRIWGWADSSQNGRKISAEFKGACPIS